MMKLMKSLMIKIYIESLIVIDSLISQALLIRRTSTTPTIIVIHLKKVRRTIAVPSTGTPTCSSMPMAERK